MLTSLRTQLAELQTVLRQLEEDPVDRGLADTAVQLFLSGTEAQMGLGQLAGVEAVVDHEVERGAEIGHIAAEGVVGVDGDVEAVEVEPVVGLEELGHVGILISLYLARGEAHTPEVGAGLLAQCVHHRRRVGVDDTRALGIEIDILLFAVHIYIYNKVERRLTRWPRP